MQKKKENLLEKIVKKDYNNELEKVLEEKNFGENEKNILLNILYKIEAAYKDYKCVKRNVETKEEIIEKIIEIIKNDCNKITLVKPSNEKTEILNGKTFMIDKRKKEIVCYPIERKVLYCIAKISKNDKIIKDKYFLIDQTLSNTINIGNCINMVEPLRDFNGFSWTTIKREIESIDHNIIYQNLRILVGYDFLNKWIYNKEYIIDYMELLKNKLSEQYGQKRSNQIIELISKLSVILETQNNSNIKEDLYRVKEEILEEVRATENMQKFIESITNKKIEITAQIGKIDEILNDKKLIKEEYEKRNEVLPLEEKIFSIRILSNIMVREREKYFEQLEELNKLLNPKNFIKHKEELIEKKKYVELLECKNPEEETKKLIIKLQKIFLECYEIKINKAEARAQIVDLLYEFRYYSKIPFDINSNIKKVPKLQEEVENIQKKLIKKADSFKIINVFSSSEKLNYEIIKNIFDTRVIDLEDLFIKIIQEKDKMYVQLYDENIFENKIEINTENMINIKEIDMKLNKKIKLFI